MQGKCNIISYSIILGTFVSFYILYAGTILELWAAWGLEEYSHAPVVVLIAIVWGIRILQDKLLPLKPSWVGATIVTLGLFLDLTGSLFSNYWISQISLVVSLLGIIAAYFGLEILRKLAAPLFFLCFAVPLPATVMPALTAKLQLWSSSLGVLGLELLGIPVLQEGNVIDLGFHKLQVAEACSGLRYLFPLTSIGFLFAFLYFRTWWKRVIFFISTLPIGILVNGFRLTATGLAASWFGISTIQGTLHEIEGFIVFGLCLIAIYYIKYLIDRLTGSNEDIEMGTVFCSFKKPLWHGNFFTLLPLTVSVFTILSLGAIGLYTLNKRVDTMHSSRQEFSSFPLRFEDWKGIPKSLSGAELNSLRLTDYLLLDFSRDSTTIPINFYIAYYAAQRQGISVHSPEICLVGSGWEVLSRSQLEISLGSSTVKPLSVTRELIQRGDVKVIVYYWLREGSEDVTGNWLAKLILMKNAVNEGRTDASLIRLSARILTDNGEQKTESAMQDLLRKIYPILPIYLQGIK